MKKTFTRIIACALIAAGVMSMSACSTEKAVSSAAADLPGSSAVAESSASSAVSSDIADKTEHSGKFATIADFVSSEEMQTGMESMNESLAGSGLSLSVTGEANKLVYTFIYDGVAESEIEDVSAGLAAALEQMSDTYKSMAAAITEAVEVENPIVKVTYLSGDGTELCTKEFAAD